MLSEQGEAPLQISSRLVDSTPSKSSNYVLSKRAIDIIGAFALCLFLLPLMGLIALFIRLNGGSIFFCQKRLGRGGAEFRFWKFRTMVPDAESALADYLTSHPEAKLEWDRTQKLRDDPRITRVGRILRKYSLDELPQLYNVLMGDMSLIGPRPMFPQQRDLYPGVLYGNLRPGITGLWQVTDRHASAFADRARYDQLYAEKLSFRTDAWIMLCTIRVVFGGTGC